MSIRPHFRRMTAALSALGLLSAPVAIPSMSAQTVIAQQPKDSKQGPVAVAQIQAPAIAIDRRSFMGFNTRHPVWVGRSKHGKSRKSGTRSKWDYRR